MCSIKFFFLFQASEELLEYNYELTTTDKYLLSNLANIRQQLDKEHEIMTEQVENLNKYINE